MRLFKLKPVRLARALSIVTLIFHLGIGYLIAGVIKNQMLASTWESSLKVYWPAMELVQILSLNVNTGYLISIGAMIMAAFLELWVIFSAIIWLVRLFFRKPPINIVSKIVIPVIVLVVVVCFYKGSPKNLGDPREPLEQAISEGDIQAVEKILKSNPSLANKPFRIGNEIPLVYAAMGRNPKTNVDLLVAAGADINMKSGGFNLTPLQQAAWGGNLEAVKALLAHKPDVNAIEGQSPGRTALNYAVNYYNNNSAVSNVEIINLLLENGAEINHGYPILFETENNPALMEYLLKRGASPNVQDLNGDTPLHRAIIFGDPNRVSIILRYHPNLKLKDGNYGTLLATALAMNRLDIALMIQNVALQDRSNSVSFAAAHGKLEDLRNLLQNNSRNLEGKDELGFTPLHWAAEAGQKDAADLLLSLGADINAKDEVNLNPLDWASFNGHLTLVELFLAKGATDLNTALFLSVQQRQNNVAKFLLAHGADPNSRYKFSNTTTVLHTAAQQGNVEMARLLLELGADVNILEQNGQTPLQYAAGQRSKELVDLLFTKGAVIPKGHGWTLFQIWALGAGDTDVAMVLLSHGADVHARDGEGKTPLHFAAQQGTLQAVEWLLKNGADVNAKDGNGSTPLSLTKYNNRGREVVRRKDIADLLRKYGAKG